jgi:hypothetical protein
VQLKPVNIITHVAGWFFFFTLVIVFVFKVPGGQDVFQNLLSMQFIIFCFVYLFLFYFNSYVLIPRLYLQKKYILYFTIVVLLFIAVYFIKPFDHLMIHGPGPEDRPMRPPEGLNQDAASPGRRPQQTDIVSIILFITVWSLSTAICIIRQWRMTEQRAIRAEADKANAELSFLKSQVNPHFLFNTLNNIYSLAVTKNENAAPSIMKLSNIMRYITDEVGENFVPLQNEVDCMSDYIDLQRMRLGDKMSVAYSVTGKTEDKKIAPLILMTFVENVFKYGISNHEASGITIKLHAEDRVISFFCQNKLFEIQRNSERTGIGIANARKRLEHLYPDKHFLNIDTNEGLFTVQLTLQA